MPQALTDRALQRAKRGTTLADQVVRGLRFSVSPGGTRTFTYRYRHPETGRICQVRIGRYGNVETGGVSLEDARKRCIALREARRSGIDPRDQITRERERRQQEAAAKHASSPYTIGQLAEDYLRARGQQWRPKTERELGRMVNTLILSRWRNVAVAQLTRRDISDALDAIHGKSPTLGNRFLWLVKAMLEFAVEKERIPASPASIIKRRHREKPRERRLDDTEIKKLLVWFDSPDCPLTPTLYDLFRFLLLTGCRLGEACGAHIGEFDLEQGRWVVPAARTKGKCDHEIFLSDQALALAKARIAESNRAGHLWPARYGTGHLRVDSVGTALRKAQTDDSHKLRRWSAHDLRRTVGSGMGELGVARDVIARVLGHRPPEVTGRHYDQSKRDRAAAEAWQRWGGHVDALGKPNVVDMKRRD